MKITSYLFRKITLIHIEVNRNGIVRKEVATVRFSKEKAIISDWTDLETYSLSKWKNSPTMIILTGEGIISKVYDKQDSTNKRIMKDADFLWDIEVTDSEEQILSFLRQDNVLDFLQLISQHHLILLDTWIYSVDFEYSIQNRLAKLYHDQFKSSALLKAPDFKSTLANILFQKIFLPVLLLFFALLLGNYFLNSHYTKQYQQQQSIVQQNKRENRMNSLEEQKKNQLSTGYNQIPNQSFALLADRIASYIPANLLLTSMNIFPLGKSADVKDKKALSIDYHIIRLKGTVETPGSVTLLSQLLESDNLFKKVKVAQLDRKKNSHLFEFELEITL